SCPLLSLITISTFKVEHFIIWKVHKQFIDEQIVAGKKILLSNNPKKGYYFSDGTRRFYQRELDYLTGQGYEFEKISDDLWQAIKK
ncbi:MAG: hypothetical protein K2K70_00485, partial [Lachnospiraceae bacterium]|nr:hypothetical protein [Lachnospiraceae bacterium]